MADQQFRIQNYTVRVYGGERPAPSDPRAMIELRAFDSDWGEILFYEPGVQLPPDTSSNGLIQMHLPATMFPSIVDLLRNEGPLWLEYADKVGHAWIMTAEEETGE
jgi:hypothetical protein